MKKLIIVLLTVATFSSCDYLNKKQSKMGKNATVIEMVLFKTNDGVTKENAKKAMTKLNDFLKAQNGFVARKTSISEDGQFLDLVFWTDLTAAKSASEKAIQDPTNMQIFNVIDQKQMTLKHFETFNNISE
ncbi:hypothetical protein ACJRPK_12080 [Aquimarina sp. 2-A2]|uniref:hypothetical protein n=1 Tax=Aquimarina sp. 2-A2 TaxID=3382644 RepID=UPI00387F10F5